MDKQGLTGLGLEASLREWGARNNVRLKFVHAAQCDLLDVVCIDLDDVDLVVVTDISRASADVAQEIRKVLKSTNEPVQPDESVSHRKCEWMVIS